jgi:multiple sugar transport system substrate-binding protein
MRRTPILVAIVALLAAGCGGGGGGSSSGEDFAPLSSSDRSGQTLRVYGFGGGDDVATNRARVARQAIAPAKAAIPEGAFDAQRFLTQLASGNVPDVIYVDRQQIATLAARGALLPLDQCVEQQEIDTSQYRQAALDEGSFDGQLYAIPEFTNQRTLIVNVQAVEDAGLKVSDISTTNWDTLKANAVKMTKQSGGKLERIGFDPKIPEFFLMWAHANGAELLSADGKTASLDDPKAVEALQYTADLIKAQGGWQKFKSFRDTWDFFGADNQVKKDQVGAWPMESWYWNVMAQNSPDVPVAAVPFTDRSGNPFTMITGAGWAIPKGAKNPSLACTWMKSMTSVEAWMTAAKKRAATTKAAGEVFTGLYTANARADQQIYDQVYTPTSPSYDAAVKLLVDVQDDAISWPASPAGAKIQQALIDATNRVLTGSATPKAALERAQQEAQTALDAATK